VQSTPSTWAFRARTRACPHVCCLGRSPCHRVGHSREHRRCCCCTSTAPVRVIESSCPRAAGNADFDAEWEAAQEVQLAEEGVRRGQASARAVQASAADAHGHCTTSHPRGAAAADLQLRQRHNALSDGVARLQQANALLTRRAQHIDAGMAALASAQRHLSRRWVQREVAKRQLQRQRDDNLMTNEMSSLLSEFPQLRPDAARLPVLAHAHCGACGSVSRRASGLALRPPRPPVQHH
jgi:hypothetical protein